MIYAMRARLYVTLLTTLLLGSACQASQISSDAEVTISGALLRQGGSPAQVDEVVLTPGFSGFGEVLGGTFFTLLSAGLVCLADSPPDLCEAFRRSGQTAGVGEDGRFRLELEGSKTKTFFGNAKPMSLSARLGDGQVVQALFRVQTEQLQLPPLSFWEPQVKTGDGTAEWDALPVSGYGKGSGYRLVFENRDGRQVWQFGTTKTNFTYNSRVLEDTSGSQTVVAERKDVAPGTTMELAFRSAPVPYSRSGAPPSRRLACSYIEEGAPPVALTPCPATDGNLFEAARLPGPEAGQSPAPVKKTAIALDLGGARKVDLVLVRGCSCTLETSADGVGWTALDSSTTADWLFEPEGAQNAAHLRLSGTSGALNGIREISVWF